jgi:hypothetical protein
MRSPALAKNGWRCYHGCYHRVSAGAVIGLFRVAAGRATPPEGDGPVEYSGEGFMGGNGCQFTVTIQGPYGRIATAAAEAAKNYLPFTPDSVTVDMRLPVIACLATPESPYFSGTYGGLSTAPRATRIVLRRDKRDPNPIQPLRVKPVPVTWSNAMGGQFHGQGVIPHFAPSDLPQKDFIVVVITEQKETRLVVRKRDFKALR